jgi:hypothetical protein
MQTHSPKDIKKPFVTVGSEGTVMPGVEISERVLPQKLRRGTADGEV